MGLAFAISVSAAEGWKTDLTAALKDAAKNKKHVLLAFTGSNWCPPCMYLEKKIFATKKFKDFAGKNLILVMCDFPRPNNLSKEQQKKNNELAVKYKIEGFPTVIIMDAKAKVLKTMVGIPEGATTPETYVKFVKKIIKK